MIYTGGSDLLARVLWAKKGQNVETVDSYGRGCHLIRLAGPVCLRPIDPGTLVPYIRSPGTDSPPLTVGQRLGVVHAEL
jgi:hypothetical protein